MNYLLDHNLYIFCRYNNKKGMLIFLGQNFVPMIQVILIFLIILQLVYESYIPLSTSIIMFLFNHMIKNQISAAATDNPIIYLFLTGTFHGQFIMQTAYEKTEWMIFNFLHLHLSYQYRLVKARYSICYHDLVCDKNTFPTLFEINLYASRSSFTSFNGYTVLVRSLLQSSSTF